MKDTLIAALDSIKVDVTSQTTITANADNLNIWLWISIVEFTIIIVLFLRQKSEHTTKTRKEQIKEKILKESVVDFDNTLQSAFHAKELYDLLKVKCHPDRFATNEEKCRIADELFQEINKNKHNYKYLLELKEMAKQKLNINL